MGAVRLKASSAAWLLLAAVFGCEGTIGAGASVRADGTGTGKGQQAGGETPMTAEECAAAPTEPGASPIRRLTRPEYDHTVHELLGDSTNPADAFPNEEIGLGFTNNSTAQSVSGLLIEAYETAAINLATAATADMAKLLGCNPATGGEDACVQGFLPNFGLRAYRRPLAADETERLLALYTTSKQSYGFTTAVRMTLQAMLQSPYFLYRVEAQGSATVTRVSPYEVASRLSYLLWSSMPDKALFDAAAAGSLATAEGVKAQAERMFDDPRADQSISSFFRQWLDLERLDKVEKDAAIFPAFTTEVRGLMRQETDLFVHDVAFGGGTMTQLLVGNYTFLNAALASFYGVTGPTGATFEKVTLPGKAQAGVLTQGSILASNANVNETSPILRGLYVRDRLLCDPPPPPPPGIPPLPAPDPSLSTRDRLSAHRADPACAGCHDMMDPIGYGFENFDAVGRWRDTDGGKPVDATGAINAGINGGTDVDGDFDGVLELANKLSQSSQVRACVAKQWFRYGSGRAESELDQCTLLDLASRWSAGGDTFRSLVIAYTESDAFLYRTNQGASP